MAALSLCTPFFGHRLALNSSVQMIVRSLKCLSSTQKLEPIVVRRSANYHSSVWDDKFVQSLKSDYEGDKYQRQHEKLKEEASNLLREASGPVAQLELINNIQCLGIGYLFENEIKEILNTIFDVVSDENCEFGMGVDLYSVSLSFRLLRQHGYKASQDVFKVFIDESGSFDTSICSDVKGLLSLYEASFLAFEGETILDEAKTFTIKHLKSASGNIDEILAKQVEHSLELPLHRRVQRLEARWYIEEVCERKQGMSPILTELAKLDYNLVQAIYQGDVKNASRWWSNLKLANKLSYTRDRLVECFLFAIGKMWHPQYRRCREEFTKVNQLITTVDDVYDVYGSLDELELFTNAFERWNTDAIEQLPEYMKICYMAVYNTANALGYQNLKEQGVNTIPCLRKAWTDLCKAYLTEARWYHNGYAPTLDEYLNNGWISISVHLVFAHGYVSMDHKISKESIECLENRSDPLKWPLILFRLIDDWGTSVDELKRGDVQKSIQCCMHELGVSEAVAREHINRLIDKGWKKMNEDQVSPSPLSKPFMGALVDTIRIASCYYLHGDGFGNSDGKTKENLIKLIVEPIPLK